MKLVKPSVEWLQQEPTLEGAKKIIEIAGRTCYKSEHLITEGSSEKFYNRMKRLGHLSVLEHGTVYLKIPNSSIAHSYIVSKYNYNPYSKVQMDNDER